MPIDLKQSFHSLSVEESFETLETTEKGLEASQVKERREQFGKNRLEAEEKKSVFAILLSQVNNPVIYLLVAAAIVSLIFSDIPEAIAIVVVILLNTAIGFWMEYKAQTSLEALKEMDPLKVKVTREGETREIKAEELVPGDLIVLDSGDLVAADARIVFASELNVDESPLTGESVPVEKNTEKLEEDTQLGDRTNMLFKGTAVTSGKARAVVTATGMDSEIGEISKMVSEAGSDKIPLNKKLGKLSRRLIWVISGLSAIFFVLGWLAGKEIYLMLQTAIAWTVAAIPEGLPIVASISLARGMLRLAKKNVVVKKLAAVETLGETTVILTDKTGTLTENRLTLDVIDLEGDALRAKEAGEWKEDERFRHFYKISVLCNDAEEDQDELHGDPLDVALLEFASDHDPDAFNALKEMKQINEDPFDSESMFMAAVHENDEGCYISAKGATAAVLDFCTHYFDGKETKKIDEEFRKKWKDKDSEHSADGLKVIGFAFREEPCKNKDQWKDQDDFAKDMTFIGLAGFIDPVRDDIADSVKTCHHAGIRVVMVTGDHPETALNIAGKIHLLEEGHDQAIHGKDLKDHKDITSAPVFARVDPAQKLDIVEKFKEQGEIVGMTGDGVNDAPALKKADIGIVMGQRGTQVAKEVADMVLKDDAFPSIIKAIEQGRIIFDNIRKFIVYQLSYHLAEIIIISAISFTTFKLPLLPLQLLFLNLLSDVFPALALGIGQGSKNIMERKPKDPEEPIITGRHWLITGLYGVVISVYVIGAYFFATEAMDLSAGLGNNVAFFSLAFGQLLHVLNMREGDEPIFRNQVTRNKYIWMALGLCSAALIAAYFIPLFRNVLSFQSLDPKIWGLIILTSLLPLITNQVLKKIWKF